MNTFTTAPRFRMSQHAVTVYPWLTDNIHTQIVDNVRNFNFPKSCMEPLAGLNKTELPSYF